eukprot:jgi/Chrzof1/7784/Cz02g36180.t1
MAAAQEKKKVSQVSPVIKGLAGSMGGIAEACALQPIDVIKTRMQLDSHGKYKIYQNLLRDKEGKLSDGRRMLAGFMAGTTEALMIVTPMEVIKIRLQQQQGGSKDLLKYKGPVHCATTIIREEGPRGLWSGATPTVVRNGTNQMCLFWAKNHMDKVLWGKHEGDGKQMSAIQSTVSGFLAACLGPTMTNPFDVVKTRMMAQAKAPPDAPRYTGFFNALIRIPREEGFLAMYKGLPARLLRIAPGQAIVWTVNDQIVGFFEKRQREQAAATPAV